VVPKKKNQTKNAAHTSWSVPKGEGEIKNIRLPWYQAAFWSQSQISSLGVTRHLRVKSRGWQLFLCRAPCQRTNMNHFFVLSFVYLCASPCLPVSVSVTAHISQHHNCWYCIYFNSEHLCEWAKILFLYAFICPCANLCLSVSICVFMTARICKINNFSEHLCE